MFQTMTTQLQSDEYLQQLAKQALIIDQQLMRM
jgi:hypothetical protein